MKITNIMMAILITLIWGASYSFAKIGVEYYPPLLFTGLRCLLITLVLLPFFPKPPLDMRNMIIFSIPSTISILMIFIALSHNIDVIMAAIMTQLIAPFTSLLSIWVLKDSIKWRRTIGLVVVFVATIILITSGEFRAHIFAGILLMLSALLAAISNLQIKKLSITRSLPVICWTSFIAFFPILIMSLCTETISFEMIINPPMEAFISLILVVVSFIFGFGVWFGLMAKMSVENIVPFSLLMPIFAVIVAIFVLHETPEIAVIIGGLLMMIGVGIFLIRRPDFMRKGNFL
jgi:O-acetylserine/cysteine efflux transporter